MRKVTLYIETSSAALVKKKRICGYILEYITASGKPVIGKAYREGEGVQFEMTELYDPEIYRPEIRYFKIEYQKTGVILTDMKKDYMILQTQVIINVS